MPTVSFAKNLEMPEEFQELEIEMHQTIYDECERNKVDLPHGCLAGSCGSCRIEILEGSENLKLASLVEQNTIEALKVEMIEKYGEASVQGKEIRLACRARLIEDGKVKFRVFK